jgi:hypothetical protein
MKTTKIYSASLLLLATLFVTGLMAATSLPGSLSENPPATNLENESLMSEFDFEDEAYIDDIPFDTECVSINCIYQKAISEVYNMDDESYIDDIPFNTELVSAQTNFQSSLKKEFKLNEEEYIDDIPFSTASIVLKDNCVQLSER